MSGLARFGRAFLAIVVAGLSASCSDPDEPARSAGPAGPFAELKSLFAARCVRCHRGSTSALVDLRDDPLLHARLTTPLETASCNARTLVVPGSLDESLLHLKVQEAPPCGARMPSECSGRGCLSDAEVRVIVDYIESGAPE